MLQFWSYCLHFIRKICSLNTHLFTFYSSQRIAVIAAYFFWKNNTFLNGYFLYHVLNYYCCQLPPNGPAVKGRFLIVEINKALSYFDQRDVVDEGRAVFCLPATLLPLLFRPPWGQRSEATSGNIVKKLFCHNFKCWSLATVGRVVVVPSFLHDRTQVQIQPSPIELGIDIQLGV